MAKVELWAYPHQYGVKRLRPPPPPPELSYPTTAGPNYEAQIDGALLTPAIVVDTPRGPVAVGNVRITVRPGSISSAPVIGIMPFQNTR